MKIILRNLFILALLNLSANQLLAQDFKELDVSPMDCAAYPTSHNEPNKLVKVIYSRPQLRGRDLESLTPVDKVWRTGANESTEITFYKDVMFGNKPVKAGVYSLFTIPGEKEWIFIINSDIDTWGAYSYNSKTDVARVSAPISESDESLEPFSIAFDEDGVMYIGWGTMRASVPVKEQYKTTIQKKE